MTETQEQKTTVIIPCRFSYLNVFEAKAIRQGQPPKFSASLIIPKTDTVTISIIQKAQDAAIQLGLKKVFGGTLPKKMDMALKDGDEDRPGDPAYKNCMYLNAKSPANQRPGIVDINVQPIIDPSVFYSGCYGRASVNFFPFNNVSVGIGCGLNNMQKLREGEPLTSRTSAEDDFKTPYEDPNEL